MKPTGTRTLMRHIRMMLMTIVIFFTAPMIKSATVTFTWKSMPDENWRQYEYIKIYQNGEEVSSDLVYPDTKNSVSVTLPAGEYSYSSTMGHKGSFNVTSTQTQTIDLFIHRLSLKFLTHGNIPITRKSVDILENGVKIATDYIDGDGSVHYYLRPSDQYAYRLNDLSGAIPELANGNADKTIICNCLSFIAKYGHYPIEDTFSALPASRCNYPVTEANQYSNTTSGRVSFNALPNEDYYLINKLGIKTGPFRSNTNPNYLEYHKVTFVSDCNGDPLIVRNISVTAKDGTAYITETTDGKGHADFYLLPGKYTWHHTSGSGDFTVTDSDQSINITPTRHTIRFTHNGTPLEGIPVQIPAKASPSQPAPKTYLTDSNGSISAEITGSQATLSINGIGEYFIDDTTPTTITIPVHKLSITSSSYQNQSLKISDSSYNSATFLYNSNIYLLEGAYNIYSSPNNTALPNAISIDHDITLDMTLLTLSVTVTDTSGKTVPGLSVYLWESGTIRASVTSDATGKVEFQLPKGNYIASDPGQALFKENINLTTSQSFTINIPAEITFNITDGGTPYTGTATWTPTGAMATSLQVTDGIVKARIDTSKPGVLSLSGFPTPDIPIVITPGATLDFVNASIDCTGKGIAIPELPGRYNYKLVKGTSLTLKAIPTQYGKFAKWTINGNEVTDDVVEFLVPENGIEAMATFSTSGSITHAPEDADAADEWGIRPNPVKHTLHFPEIIDAHVSIYDLSGVKVKSLRVMSDSMNVADMQPGHYILISEPTGSKLPIRKARFIKE